MSLPGSPLIGRGAIADNGDDSVTGDNGYSKATIVIQWHHWRQGLGIRFGLWLELAAFALAIGTIVTIATNGAIGTTVTNNAIRANASP